MSKFLEHKKCFVGQQPCAFIFIYICFHGCTYTHFRKNHRDTLKLPLIIIRYQVTIVSCGVCAFFLAAFGWFSPLILEYWSCSLPIGCNLTEKSAYGHSLAYSLLVYVDEACSL